jgi:hypothetical protein
MLNIVRIIRAPYSAELNIEKLSRWLHVLTNRERSRHGLIPVQRLAKLEDVSMFHSTNMARKGFFNHLDPEGSFPKDRIRKIHPELIARVGENLAMVASAPEEELAPLLVKYWMNSPGHRANILEPSWTHLGLGFHQTGCYVFATQLFAEVVAEQLGETPPLRATVGQRRVLRFVYLGRFPKDSLFVTLGEPDLACFPVGNGYYGIKWRPLEMVWTGECFSVSFEPRQPGEYKIVIMKSPESFLLGSMSVYAD